jgi:hypothetical protein
VSQVPWTNPWKLIRTSLNIPGSRTRSHTFFAFLLLTPLRKMLKSALDYLRRVELSAFRSNHVESMSSS